MPVDKRRIEEVYDSIRQQVKHTYGIETVHLTTFQWDIILALVAQELGVQSMIGAELREEPIARR